MIERKNSRERTTCGCRSVANLSPLPNQNQNESSACKNLLYRLQVLDFSIVDTALYLDAYPDSKEALKYYQQLIGERTQLTQALAERCQAPVTNFENSGNAWNWVNGPWPWDASAN